MKKVLLFSLSLLAMACGNRPVNDLYPTLGKQIDMNEEGERDFKRRQLEGVEEFPDSKENYWDILGVGCSFYCGAYRVEPVVTSELPAHDGETFIGCNLHDNSCKTAWVEGVDGYGVGESATYTFPSQQPRITDVIVLNGFLKSDKDWHDYSRAKTLNMYVADTLYAVLHLEDSKQEQIFKVDPIGHADRKDEEALMKKPEIVIRFEIADTYPGDKYDATAITEIYFDGIDVH